MKGSVRKRGDKWYYCFDLGIVDGKRKRVEKVGGNTKKEAEATMRKAIRDYEQAGMIFTPSEITVTDYLEYWMKEYTELNCKYGTVKLYRSVTNNHITPKIGKYKLRTITPAICQSLINDCFKNGMSQTMLHKVNVILYSAFKMAVHPYQFIRENPMQYVEKPKFVKQTEEKTYKVVSPDVFEKITSKFDLSKKQYLPLMIGYYTGCRIGECLAMTWDNVDLDAKTVTVAHTLIQKKGSQFSLGTPKTPSSFRTIYISDALVSILKQYKAQQARNRLRYGQYYTHYYEDANGDLFTSADETLTPVNLVCTWENGRLVTFECMNTAIEYTQDNLDPDFTFHNLRHTHATTLIANGANLKDVQRRLGHSSISITMDIYAHLLKDTSKQTVEIFDNSILPTSGVNGQQNVGKTAN